MRVQSLSVALLVAASGFITSANAQGGGGAAGGGGAGGGAGRGRGAATPEQAAAQQVDQTRDSLVRVMVTRLTLDRYKTTLQGLSNFGDRRQGTDRNRAALDWIEAQLKSYGCTNTERITY